MRGEDKPHPDVAAVQGETPPHAWGRPCPNKWKSRMKRNTPTCVGKTALTKEAGARFEKHPHMRGEDIRNISDNCPEKETPPHAWGRPWRCPATCRLKWKHPHMRGEDPSGHGGHAAALETPPHAWGRPAPAEAAPRPTGNTPTCVGKTEVEATDIKPFGKHPHMRGEDVIHSPTSFR